MAMYGNTCVPATIGGGSSVCGVGMTFVQGYGCVPQGNCQVNQAWLNNVCVQGLAMNPTTGYGAGYYGYTTNPYYGGGYYHGF
jgi:hypothetical protein